jgi:hypothetical protein
MRSADVKAFIPDIASLIWASTERGAKLPQRSGRRDGALGGAGEQQIGSQAEK